MFQRNNYVTYLSELSKQGTCNTQAFGKKMHCYISKYNYKVCNLKLCNVSYLDNFAHMYVGMYLKLTE
jgi:hypothetical protein